MLCTHVFKLAHTCCVYHSVVHCIALLLLPLLNAIPDHLPTIPLPTHTMVTAGGARGAVVSAAAIGGAVLGFYVQDVVKRRREERIEQRVEAEVARILNERAAAIAARGGAAAAAAGGGSGVVADDAGVADLGVGGSSRPLA